MEKGRNPLRKPVSHACCRLNSLERKYAILDSVLQYHNGEVRAWGGDWELRQGPLDAPSWAKPAPVAEVLALELRTNPLGTTSYVPQTYTEQEVLKQIDDGKRPDMDKIVGFFWAPGMAVAFGTEQTHLVRRVQSWHLPSMITMLGNHGLSRRSTKCGASCP